MVKAKYCRNVDNNELVVVLYGLDNVEYHDLMQFVDNLNKQSLNRKEEEIPAEECAILGEQHVVPCGALYKGLTIKDVYSTYMIEGLWDILKATPRKDGSEDRELHDAPLTKVVPVCHEAWSYFFNVVVEEMTPESWAVIVNGLNGYGGETDGYNGAKRMFSDACLDYADFLDASKMVIKTLPAYAGKTIAQIYEDGGERSVASMMYEATKAVDVESFDIGRKFLKELHGFKGFINTDEIATLYHIDKKNPDEIVATCNERMDARYDQLVEEKKTKGE